jgi:protein-L-isoaspartate(D-aspartate) O-methyltransferase
MTWLAPLRLWFLGGLLPGLGLLPLTLLAGDDRAAERDRMVTETISARGVTDPAVLRALRAVPRHELVPPAMRPYAYWDRPLPIGEEQTISQPYIVALMTELARVKPDSRVLEIGTGSGYQAAVLAEIVTAGKVYTIEIVPPLARRAAADLARLGYTNIETREGDGYLGWPEAAPFDAIIVTAAPPRIPPPLLDQLAVGGRLVIPVGVGTQELKVVTRTARGIREERNVPVRFVPMTGQAQGPSG